MFELDKGSMILLQVHVILWGSLQRYPATFLFWDGNVDITGDLQNILEDLAPL